MLRPPPETHKGLQTPYEFLPPLNKEIAFQLYPFYCIGFSNLPKYYCFLTFYVTIHKNVDFNLSNRYKLSFIQSLRLFLS